MGFEAAPAASPPTTLLQVPADSHRRGEPAAESERLLIVRPRGGLANRLRVVASAALTARHAGRQLRLDWPLDGNCGARWEELFDNELVAFAGALPDGTRRFAGERVNFAVPGPGDAGEDPAPVTWVSTCFNFKPRAVSMERFLAAKAEFYRQLRPVAVVRNAVADLVDRQFAGRPVVGVHIRRGDLVLVGDPPQYISPTAAFVARLRGLIEQEPATKLFLATDDPAEEAALRAAFPERVLTQAKAHPRREAREGIQEALVDWLALGRTQRIVRSAGSSFSREAAIAGGVPRETIRRRFWPYNRRRFWLEAWRRRVSVVRRRFAPRDGGE